MFQKHKREDVEDHKQQDVWHQHRNWGHNTTAECLGQVLGLERHTICAFGHTELKIELTMQKISLIISSYLVFQNSMNLPPDKARLLRQYDNEKKWDLICDQVHPIHCYRVIELSCYRVVETLSVINALFLKSPMKCEMYVVPPACIVCVEDFHWCPKTKWKQVSSPGFGQQNQSLQCASSSVIFP